MTEFEDKVDWIGDDGLVYWSWSTIRDRFRVKRRELNEAVMLGKVRTQRFVNRRSKRRDMSFEGYFSGEILELFVRRKKIRYPKGRRSPGKVK